MLWAYLDLGVGDAGAVTLFGRRDADDGGDGGRKAQANNCR
jgi:hypothetical protein